MDNIPTTNNSNVVDNSWRNKLFWYAAIITFVGIGFLFMLIYIPVPKGHERYADNILGFMEGSVITTAIAYLLVGNLPANVTAKKIDKVDSVSTSTTTTIGEIEPQSPITP